MTPTPARIIHNWDFVPRPVSQATKQYLFLMQRKPVIDISQTNQKVCSFFYIKIIKSNLHKGPLILLCRIISKECPKNFEYSVSFSIVVYALNWLWFVIDLV